MAKNRKPKRGVKKKKRQLTPESETTSEQKGGKKGVVGCVAGRRGGKVWATVGGENGGVVGEKENLNKKEGDLCGGPN